MEKPFPAILLCAPKNAHQKSIVPYAYPTANIAILIQKINAFAFIRSFFAILRPCRDSARKQRSDRS